MSIEAWHGRSGPVAPSPARRDAVSLRRGRLEAGNVGSHDYHPLHQTGTTPLPVLDRFSCASRKNSKKWPSSPFSPFLPFPIPSHNPRPVPAFKDETTHSSRRLRLRETAIQL